MTILADTKCAIIQETSKQERNLLCIWHLCTVAGVSRSGSYHHLANHLSCSIYFLYSFQLEEGDYSYL